MFLKFIQRPSRVRGHGLADDLRHLPALVVPVLKGLLAGFLA